MGLFVSQIAFLLYLLMFLILKDSVTPCSFLSNLSGNAIEIQAAEKSAPSEGLQTAIFIKPCNAAGVLALLVRSLPSSHKVPGSIPIFAEIQIFVQPFFSA